MTIINGYTTLQQVKDLLKIEQDDFADDAVIEDLISQASRWIDTETGRRFYPSVETHSLNVPDGRGLYLDDDLLAITTLTNGDGTVITSTDYILLPSRAYPKYAIALTESTNTYWETDSSTNSEQVIDVLGYWGCHRDYASRAWLNATTLNEGAQLNATDTTFTVLSRAKIKIGNIIKIENELMIVTGLNASDVTVWQRGDNGSTAATHADLTAVYVWQVEPQIEMACKLIVTNMYHNRFGSNTTGTATVTSFGVVLAPEDIPASVHKIVASFRRLV